jgi:flavin-dependent dehydrogenase
MTAASREEFDVAVIGAGPGGTTAAISLARRGAKTLLIDKAHFPRDKSCGDAVCSQSAAIVRELGLAGQIERQEFAFAHGESFTSTRGHTLYLPFVTSAGVPAVASPTPAYLIRREIFDDVLMQAARREDNVVVQEGVSFSDFSRESGKIVGIVTSGPDGTEQRVRAKVVIGADGALSRVAEKAGSYDFRSRDRRHWIAAVRAYYDNSGGPEARDGDPLRRRGVSRLLLDLSGR